MLTKISKIQKFTRIESCNWDSGNKPFGKSNLIYGPNGVGKTTITNILGLISLNSSENKEKILKEYTKNDEYIFECEIDGNKKKIDSKTKSISEKISIFNSAFVNSHVFNGTNLKTKEFSQIVTQEQLSNPEIKKINERLNEITKSITGEKTIKETIERLFQKKKAEVSAMHNAKTNEFRMPVVSMKEGVEITAKSSNITNQLDKLYLSHIQAKNSSLLEAEIQKINAVVLEKLVEDLSPLDLILNKNIKQNAESRMKKLIIDLSNDEKLGHEDWSTWFSNANSLIVLAKKNNQLNCPVCDSDLSGKVDKILEEFSALFTEEVDTLNNDIDKWITKIAEIERIIGQNIQKLTTLSSSLKTLNIQDKIKLNFQSDKSSLKNKLSLLKNNLNGKKGNFSKQFDVIEVLSEISIDASSFNQSCEDYLEEVKAEAKKMQESLSQPRVIEQEIKKFLESLVYAKTNEDLADSLSVDSFYKSHAAIEEFIKEEDSLKKQLSDELQKLRNESKLINIYLKKLGFHNFSVDFKVQSEHGIAVRYGDVSRTDLSFCLSEGEKTALAFAYFLSKINHEITQNVDEKIEDHIVIIDDPISSLDENRLNLTAFLINQTFQSFRQVFILSHNLVFLKVMGSQFEPKERSDYYLEFLDGVLTIKHTPHELTNYGTTYYLKLKEIIQAKNGEVKYEEAKKFIPNYSRIVLETFFSFKFYILKQGASNDKFRTPGMDKFIGFLSGNTQHFKNNSPRGNISKENVIEKLENIKNMTDGHSHGGSQLVDEYIFLSKTELDILVDDTLNIIAFFDQIHFGEIIKTRA